MCSQNVLMSKAVYNAQTIRFVLACGGSLPS